MSALAPTLQAFFTERLMSQRGASAHTIASYRDTFRILLGFAERQTGKVPSQLQIEDLDARLIGAFLEHLEGERETRFARETPDWPRFTPSSAMPRCDTPNRRA